MRLTHDMIESYSRKRRKEPCLICKGRRRKRQHFVPYKKILLIKLFSGLVFLFEKNCKKAQKITSYAIL